MNISPKRLDIVRAYFIFISVITAVFGMTLIMQPGFINDLFFTSNITAATTFFIRITGSTLVGYASLNALVSRRHNADLYKIAALSNLATLTAATIITLISYSDYTGNGWILPLQHLLFATGFAISLKLLR